MLCGALIAPAAGYAQAGAFATASFTAAHRYESNVFATPESLEPQSDFISQAGPSLAAGYVSMPFELAVNYEILAERYQRHAALNRNAGRQELGLTMRYQPRERLRWDVAAGYISTQAPAELNVHSGLEIGRAPAERVSVSSVATFNFTRATNLNASYTFDRDVLIGRTTALTHRPRIGMHTRTGVRNAYRVEYEARQFEFSGGMPLVSHALVGGWTHELTQRLNYEIAVGPRYSDGAVRPEASTRLRWRHEDVDVLVSYVHTDMTAIGERGTFDVHAYSTGINYRPSRHTAIEVAPSVSRSARGPRAIFVYAVDARSSVDVTRAFSIAAIARMSRQDGSLTGPRRVIANRSLGVHLTFSPLRRVSRTTH